MLEKLLVIMINIFFMGFLHDDNKGDFVGEISNPIQISIDNFGLISFVINLLKQV